ncbi:tRNA 2-selenouridine(34) synthase MnmH [Marinobacterium sediminicola]|uniref:tRNA 2-selenouridine synthase n=1 Tax=Marinobacterium sediminicola TaxID=518898 RepID=A0ABY1RXJ6_9GAMM|nr:tRNA 2-selenouridine(34) synthase MnmH [Marinobacterium sediminicola]ULG67772.1 tRNA 2-selenouridine(34) synthase MnmH [Marinobacterium sediminicola]SMR71575.1 tRNA 2-selenouridine synthase [Marinobacterium sediminicola]
MRDNCADYRQIFLSGAALLDTRAPIEFAKGAFPESKNLPLMTDDERHRVGTCYKQHGQDAAIKLGHRLVDGEIKEARVQGWVEFARANPNGFLYCFRGGLRSRITQQWLHEAGIDYPMIVGGYKALRGFLIDTLDQAAVQFRFTQLGGLTGCGKTELLHQLGNALDLEGHANHRGSSFGRHARPQPTQINFENALAIDILRKADAGVSHFVVEDENRAIGSCHVPLELHRRLVDSPLIWLEDSIENRVERILKDYVVDLSAEFIALEGEIDGYSAYAKRLRQSLKNITKRLGAERYQRLAGIMDEALAVQMQTGDTARHRDWISALLNEYYDPMYRFQSERNAGRVIFRGNHEEVLEFLKQ